jgi:hypothetical protein
MSMQRSRIIWLGDLNYRVSLSYEETKALLEENEWDILLEKDQVSYQLLSISYIYIKKSPYEQDFSDMLQCYYRETQ